MSALVILSLCGGSIFKESARLAFDDGHSVMGANRTMKRLKHIVRGTIVMVDSLPLMRVSFIEWILDTTLETLAWQNIALRDFQTSISLAKPSPLSCKSFAIRFFAKIFRYISSLNGD